MIDFIYAACTTFFVIELILLITRWFNILIIHYIWIF